MADDLDESPPIETVDGEIRELLGLFDVPSFARRGQEMEQSLKRLHARCERERESLLDMVHLRLRQWVAAVEGPDAWREVFTASLEELMSQTGLVEPSWGGRPASPRRRRAIGGDLVASVARFNRRWSKYLDGLNLDAVNLLIDHYNAYYVLEKECVLSSARLAARHFVPQSRVDTALLLARFPLMPVPELRNR